MTDKTKNVDSEETVDRVWLTGAAAIAKSIGMGRNDIPMLVAEEGFPAFKYRQRWRALPEDVLRWTQSKAKMHRRRSPRPKTRIPTGRNSTI